MDAEGSRPTQRYGGRHRKATLARGSSYSMASHWPPEKYPSGVNRGFLVIPPEAAGSHWNLALPPGPWALASQATWCAAGNATLIALQGPF